MKTSRPFAAAVLSGLLVVSLGGVLHAQDGESGVVDHVMFGSCLDETRAHPVLHVAVNADPDAFVFLGDNVYADSADPRWIRRSYRRLAESPLFQALRRRTEVYATWDDHDYGKNDAGANFAAREVSEEIFEEFWGLDGPAARRPGIYRAISLGSPERRVQLLLLDTRSFRSELARARQREAGKGPYGRRTDGTILGEEQWRWLERQLSQPADLRIIASSIQVLAEHHGWESWANFPHEQRRLLSLVSGSEGASLFISGDRHFAEISRVQPDDGNAHVDITSSGINRRYPAEVPTANANRVDGYYLDPNVGGLRIDWDEGVVRTVTARIYDAAGHVRLEHEISF
jgi:alkaline phosphatase D